MSFAEVWRDVRSAAESRREDATFLAPSSRRRFTVEAVVDDRIDVAFPDDGDERSLLADQFEVLYDRLEAAPVGLDLGDLPPGVEPYATLLSLSPRYAVGQEGRVLRVADEPPAGTPLVVEGRPEPTPPERVHGDLLLLADLVERLDVEAPQSLSTERLADLYVLLSEVQWDANALRRAVSDVLADRMGPGGRLHGRFGTVTRAARERRTPKPDEAVFAALDAEGIPREWVLGVDPEKLDVVLAVTDLDAPSVYDVTEQVYVQKTGVDVGAKRSRLQGVKDRLGALATDEADALLADVEALEDQLEELLAAG